MMTIINAGADIGSKVAYLTLRDLAKEAQRDKVGRPKKLGIVVSPDDFTVPPAGARMCCARRARYLCAFL